MPPLQDVPMLIPGKKDFAVVIKDLEMGRLSWVLSVWALNVITGVLVRQDGQTVVVEVMTEARLESCKEGGMGQGMPMVPGSSKRQARRLSPGASRRNPACTHLDFSPVRLILEMWPPELLRS